MMKNFEIYFVGRFREDKEYFTEIIQAQNATSALKKFAKNQKIKDFDSLQNNPSFRWWDEQDWLMEFRSIKLVTEQSCPHCQGTGKILIEENAAI